MTDSNVEKRKDANAYYGETNKSGLEHGKGVKHDRSFNQRYMVLKDIIREGGSAIG